MFTTWIGYCLLVSGLLALAAFAGERALHHYRKPARWVWVAAIVGSLTVPTAAFFAPDLFVGAEEPIPAIAVPGSPAVTLMPTVPVDAPSLGLQLAAFAQALSPWLGLVWGAAILLMGIYLGRTYRRLRREMRDWTPGEVQSAPVLMSDNRGPAVIGLRRAVIVLPNWIAELEEEMVRLVFLHEQEHRRAGDHRLYAFGLAALVLMPWNLFVWAQVARLRLAIEFDCDQRVLARGAEPRQYAEALLAVGSRTSGPLLATAAFAERRPSVERRLRRMTEPLSQFRGPRTFGAAGVAALALVLLFGTQPPLGFGGGDAPDVAVMVPATDGSSPDRPAFIPYDVPPVLTNGQQVQDAIDQAYPEADKIPGVGHRVEVWLRVDERGSVTSHQIKTSSGRPSLDAAAQEVAETMEFRPARNRDQPTAVWVSQWFTFAPPDLSELQAQTPRYALNGILQPDGWSPQGIQGVLDANRLSVGEAQAKYGVSRIVIEVTQGEGGEGEVISVPPQSETMQLLIRPDEAGEEDAEQDDGGPVDRLSLSAGGPLIVVDGVIQSEAVQLSELEALDIDHVEVIKGDAAREKYGDRARNGVVEITTKGGGS